MKADAFSVPSIGGVVVHTDRGGWDLGWVLRPRQP